MNDLIRLELAVRRAAGQMPNHQSRAFRLLAKEIAILQEFPDETALPLLESYRKSDATLGD